MSLKAFYLSKSQILKAIQCHKSLWMAKYKQEEAKPLDEALLQILEQGTDVGKEAQKLFPQGVIVDNEPDDFNGASLKTTELLESGAEVIFEATFQTKGLYCKADILIKVKGGYKIIEVKSSTELKDEYIMDVAVQKYILEQAGLNVISTSVMHLNKNCKFPDLKSLFTEVQLELELDPFYLGLDELILEIRRMLSVEEPETELGSRCKDPHECQFFDYCKRIKGIPEVSVMNLPYIGKKAFDLIDEEIITLNDPRLQIKNVNQLRMINAHNSGKQVSNKNEIKAELKSLYSPLPLAHLDFETLGYAVPRFKNTHPYQNVPFQFSVCIQDDLGGKKYFISFLHGENTDPRENLVKALIKAVPAKGSVVAYNKSFEGTVIKELINEYPEYTNELQSIKDRLVDPLSLLRDSFYDPVQNGRFGLKVISKLLGLDYKSLQIGDGRAAQRAYYEMIDEKTDKETRENHRLNLILYCNQDVLATAKLVEFLYELVA